MPTMDNLFVNTGKIPTASDFWNLDTAEFFDGNGITEGFRQIIAEQMFLPLNTPATPFYNRFASRSIDRGKGWTESGIYRDESKQFNPKATAQDALGFYDSEGIQKDFVVNYKGWRPKSLASNLETIKEFIKEGSAAELNDLLVNSQIDGYQLDMESAIEKKLISTTKASKEFTATDFDALLDMITDVACDMYSDDVQYNDLTGAQNKKIWTHAQTVLLFIERRTMKAIRKSREQLHSPQSIADIMREAGVTIIETNNALPTPLTTSEWSAGQVSNGWKGDTPAALDQPAPLAFMCDARRCEYRPLLGGYRMNMTPNGAGDFTNMHLIYQGSIAVKPWWNAVRINEAAA